MHNFDTRYGNTEKIAKGFESGLVEARPLSESAAKLIEKELKNLGLEIIAQRESATVFLENGRTTGATLKEGKEKRYEQIGLQVGRVIAARGMAILA